MYSAPLVSGNRFGQDKRNNSQVTTGKEMGRGTKNEWDSTLIDSQTVVFSEGVRVLFAVIEEEAQRALDT